MYEEQGNAQTKSLQKRIIIAAINGIIGAILGTIFFFNIGWLIGLLIFVVNVVTSMIWEKNENVQTKSELLIFLSPVIKGVIIGALARGINNIFLTVYGALIGAVIGLLHFLVKMTPKEEKSKIIRKSPFIVKLTLILTLFGSIIYEIWLFYSFWFSFFYFGIIIQIYFGLSIGIGTIMLLTSLVGQRFKLNDVRIKKLRNKSFIPLVMIPVISICSLDAYGFLFFPTPGGIALFLLVLACYWLLNNFQDFTLSAFKEKAKLIILNVFLIIFLVTPVLTDRLVIRSNSSVSISYGFDEFTETEEIELIDKVESVDLSLLFNASFIPNSKKDSLGRIREYYEDVLTESDYVLLLDTIGYEKVDYNMDGIKVGAGLIINYSVITEDFFYDHNQSNLVEVTIQLPNGSIFLAAFYQGEFNEYYPYQYGYVNYSHEAINTGVSVFYLDIPIRIINFSLIYRTLYGNVGGEFWTKYLWIITDDGGSILAIIWRNSEVMVA